MQDPNTTLMDRLVASPCCNPELTLDEALAAYSNLGFRQFEAFTGWCQSAFDWEQDPRSYLAVGERYGMRFSSLHLPPVNDDPDSVRRALQAARFGAAVGAEVVLFKANSRQNYVRHAGAFLDGLDEIGVTPVLQNHAGSPLSSLADFREVIDGIGDARMRTLLEVGHFHAVGVSWRAGYELLGESIALVHLKDMVGAQSVPFGTGEVDLPGLFATLEGAGYGGNYVVEMEVEDRENTLRHLAEARDYLAQRCLGAACV